MVKGMSCAPYLLQLVPKRWQGTIAAVVLAQITIVEVTFQVLLSHKSAVTKAAVQVNMHCCSRQACIECKGHSLSLKC